MKRILIPMCLILSAQITVAQRTNQYRSVHRLFFEGKEMFALKNYSGCTDKLYAFKKNAKDVDLIEESDYMLVVSAFKQGLPLASNQLKDFIEKYPDTPHIDNVNFLTGTIHFGNKEYEKALYWLNLCNLDNLSLEDQETYSYRKAYTLLQLKQTDKARGYFERISQIGKKYQKPATYYIAYIDYIDGDYNSALPKFAKLKDEANYRQQALNYTMQILYIQNKLTRAEKEADILITDYPNSENLFEAYRIKGNALYQKGDHTQALRYLQEYATSTNRPLRGDLYKLGICLFEQHQYTEAIEWLGQTVTLDDALTQNAYLYLGQSYLQANDKDKARMAFESAATATFDKQVQEVALYNYALLVHETSFTGFGESVTIFEDFLNDFPNSKYADKVSDYLVETYLTTNNYEKALESIQKIKVPSLKIQRAQQDILLQLGTQAYINVKIDKAQSFFNQAIQQGNTNPEAKSKAYFWRGETFYYQKEYSRAITDYKTYLNTCVDKTEKTYPLAYYDIAYSYFKMKEYSQALNFFSSYTQLSSSTKNTTALADAYNRLGDCLYHNREFNEAQTYYDLAVRTRPEAGDYAVYQKGFLLGLKKKYKEKISVMDQLAQDYPQSPYLNNALYEKGRAYVMIGDNQQAALAFEQLVANNAENSLARKASIQLGLIYNNEHQTDQAITAYKRVVSKFPGSNEAKTALEDLKTIYMDKNKVDDYANYVNSLEGNAHFEASEQDSLTYIAAEKTFMRGNQDLAKESMENYITHFPQGAFITHANYYIATIAYYQKDYEKAKNLYAKIILTGNQKFLEPSLANKARIEWNQQDYKNALVTYKRLLAIAEQPENLRSAKLGLMRSAEKIEATSDILFGAEELLKETKLSPEIEAEARYFRAKVYLKQGRSAAAIPDLTELSKDTRTVYGAESTYRLAQVYSDSQKDKQAEKVLMQFIKKGTPHTYWLARGFVLLSDIYMARGDSFQARQYLTSLKKNYKNDDDITPMISKRMSQLDQLSKQTKKKDNEK